MLNSLCLHTNTGRACCQQQNAIFQTAVAEHAIDQDTARPATLSKLAQRLEQIQLTILQIRMTSRSFRLICETQTDDRDRQSLPEIF